MTALDIAVLLLIGGAALRGFMRGFVAEAVAIAGLFAAIVAVRLFHAPVTALIAPKIGTQSGGAILAFVLVFGAVYGLGRVLAAQMGRHTRASVLGPVDRVLGIGFGAVKGLLVATVAFVLFSLAFDTLYGASERRPEWVRDSRTFPLLAASGAAMSQWFAERSLNGGLLGDATAQNISKAKMA